MGKIKSVLLICTGNSCRSVMAEGLLKRYLKGLGKNDISVSSCGIRALEGLPPTDATIEVMKEERIDVSGFKSSAFTPEIAKKADLILVMEAMHKDYVKTSVPEAASKVYLLKEYGRPAKDTYPQGVDIPDPIGRPIKDYKMSFEIIKKEIERIAKLL